MTPADFALAPGAPSGGDGVDDLPIGGGVPVPAVPTHGSARDLVIVWSSKDVSTHNEVKHANMRRTVSAFASYRDLSVITAAQPPRESSGTLAVWTSPVTAPDEVYTKPVRSEAHQRNWLFIIIEQNVRIGEEDRQ